MKHRRNPQLFQRFRRYLTDGRLWQRIDSEISDWLLWGRNESDFVHIALF
jgi:hypothetical protein